MAVYEIRVKGHLDGRWSEWFDGLQITNVENGDALLSGEIVDQSALHGVLNKVRDLNLALISMTSVDPDQQEPAISRANRLAKFTHFTPGNCQEGLTSVLVLPLHSSFFV